MNDRRRIAVVLAGAAAFLSLYAPQSLMPLLHDWLGSNAALAGLIVSAGTFGVAVAAPFAGLLADRIGRRRVIVLAAFLVVLPTTAVALAQSPTQLIVGRLIQGMLLPGIFGVTIAYIGTEWPAAQGRQVTAMYVAGTIGGGFCGRLISGVVAEFAGWQWALGALAAGQLLLALAIRAWLPPERQRVVSSGAPLKTMLGLLRRAELRGAYLVGFTLLFALVGGFTYVTLRLAQPPFSLGPAALSAIFAVYLVSIAVTPLSGRLLNRYGHARVLMLAWAIAITGLGLSVLSSLTVVIVGLALFSAGVFIAQTSATSFVAEASGAARATSVGLYVLCYYLGGSVGGVLPAALWMYFGWPGVAVLIAAIGLLSATVGRRSFRYALRPAANAAAPLPEVGGESP